MLRSENSARTPKPEEIMMGTCRYRDIAGPVFAGPAARLRRIHDIHQFWILIRMIA
jgi:hypothetical protein